MVMRLQEEEQQINTSEVTHLQQLTLIEKLEQQLKEALQRAQNETQQEVFYTEVEDPQSKEITSESGNSDKKKTSPSRFIAVKESLLDGLQDAERKKQNSSRNKPLQNNRTQARINQIQEKDEANRSSKINSALNKKTLDPDRIYEKAEASTNTALKGPLPRKNRSTMRVSSESEGQSIHMGKQSLIFNPIQNNQQTGIINRITQNKLNSQPIQSAQLKKPDDKQAEKERKYERKIIEKKEKEVIKKSDEIEEEIHVETHPKKEEKQSKEEKEEVEEIIAEELDEKHHEPTPKPKQQEKPEPKETPSEEEDLTRRKSLISNYVNQ
jgi:hypothetical protein